MQQMVARITEVCFDKCMGTPGRSLSNREGSCLRDCAKRYLDATQVQVTSLCANSLEKAPTVS